MVRELTKSTRRQQAENGTRRYMRAPKHLMSPDLLFGSLPKRLGLNPRESDRKRGARQKHAKICSKMPWHGIHQPCTRRGKKTGNANGRGEKSGGGSSPGPLLHHRRKLRMALVFPSTMISVCPFPSSFRAPHSLRLKWASFLACARKYPPVD